MGNRLNTTNGKSIIVSAPSGAGKTTLVRFLLREIHELSFSVSACSRPPRDREIDGVDYHFISIDEFKRKIHQSEFVEWEEVYENNFYGTLKSEVEKIWSAGKVVIFDVDVEGGINLKRIFADTALSLFIQPPSLFVLEQRLRDRRTETPESIQKRLTKAGKELTKFGEFDRVIVNDNLEKACLEAKKVVLDFLAP